MFYLIQSNRMESLSQQLADLLKRPTEISSVLQPQQILVQSPGMSTWLRLEIAKHNNIAAAIDFPLPSSFTWQLYHNLLTDVPEENAFTKPMMTWKLMSLLPSLIDNDEFTPLKDYLASQQDSNSEQLQLKYYQLCNRIADTFDQYLVYRPDWIDGWEQGEQPIELAENQQWQPILWRGLIEFNHQQLQQNPYHRANLHQALLDAIEDPETKLTDIPSQLFVFGISSMPPQLLEILHKLAQRIDVFMFNLSPCQHYWGDIVDPKLRAKMAIQFENKQLLPEQWEDSLQVGNPLLANNGKMGRELLDLVLELPEDNVELGFEHYQDPLNPQHPSLLHELQHDILEMETLGEPLGPDSDIYNNPNKRRILDDNDHSLLVNSCHSPLREVETLHDHLLSLLEADPKLQPKDIVIMLPDVASYAPYIDAVFSAKQGSHYIPYAIADRGAAQESPLVNSFLSLLTLNLSRFSLSEITSILEVSAVMRRFNIDDDDLVIIKHWLNEAGVRWGRNKDNRHEFNVPSFEQNSWAFGLKRLILGYSLGDDADLYQGSLKTEGVEGMSAQALGKLLNFIEAIDNWYYTLNQPVTCTQRIEQLEALVESFYLIDNDERSQIQDIRDAISKLKQEITQAKFDEELAPMTLFSWFNSELNQSRVGQRYLAGNVNFCTLMPMRSIPFKVVCLLGMNDGVYPRNQYPISFDLMSHFASRKGDRSRRLDDRYLFLEALLSARQHLYISFVGLSERDNSERIPSMLVSELLDYCQLCYQLPDGGNKITDRLINQQPLQAFDTALYDDEAPHARSYDKQWCPPSTKQPPAAFINSALSSDDDETQDILELSSLIRFFRNPAQYFFNRTLNLDLGLQIEQDENDEPFVLNALERYQVQSLLLNHTVETQAEYIDDSLIEHLKANGQLPVTPFDDLLIKQYQSDISATAGRAIYLKGDGQSISAEIKLEFPQLFSGITLVGRVDDISGKGLINLRPGKSHGRDLLRVYLRHLAINAMGIHKPSFLIDVSHFHTFEPIEASQAHNTLAKLIELYFSGLEKPLLLPPKTAMAYVSTDDEHDEKMAEAEKAWSGEFGEGEDPHYQRLFTFPDDFDDNFIQLSKTVFDPLIDIYYTDKLDGLQPYVESQSKGDK
ncbi:exodeoxyribonuclease V subunit gamma [Parashewanella curva]|uniref:RecBCD enzyme subunit RecC n=1 Tax=Parashewanella curva TaxID=2338552 RepID=A0A3L8PW23_9GAMM|nr:exodeoxyribonuclease V subunit gamma [Parashewanella curva]RLV58989.1 exodeoxyribonuclease V subunit gamma [Parashewanella curva]